jgi:hypothetical protein
MPPIAAKWLNQKEYSAPRAEEVVSPHIKRMPRKPKILARLGTAIKEDVIPGYTGYIQNMRQGTAAIAGDPVRFWQHCLTLFFWRQAPTITVGRRRTKCTILSEPCLASGAPSSRTAPWRSRRTSSSDPTPTLIRSHRKCSRRTSTHHHSHCSQQANPRFKTNSKNR